VDAVRALLVALGRHRRRDLHGRDADPLGGPGTTATRRGAGSGRNVMSDGLLPRLQIADVDR
jgi:hypothetical protein